LEVRELEWAGRIVFNETDDDPLQLNSTTYYYSHGEWRSIELLETEKGRSFFCTFPVERGARGRKFAFTFILSPNEEIGIEAQLLLPCR
jgi:hypothetical protein